MRKIRVLIVDDSPFSQAVIQKALPENNFEICGLAKNGQEGLAKYVVLKPDVVIMDITMPRLDGLEATRQIVCETPAVRVIGLSMHEKEDMAASMRRAGAVEYLTKGCPAEDLIAAIRSAVGRER